MLDRGVIYNSPGSSIWKQVMSTMPHPYPVLAGRMRIPSSWDEYYNMTKYDVFEQESVNFLDN